MKRTVCGLLLLLAMTAFADKEAMRTWTSTKGDTVKAEFVRMFPGDKVLLKTEDGRDLKIPVSGLCEADRDYLASIVPPKLEIDVDVDVDDDIAYSSEWSQRKKQNTKGVITIKKKNREPCSRSFKVHIYLFAGQVRGDNLWVIACEEQKLAFSEKDKEVTFTCKGVETEYYDSDMSNAQGYRYASYLVVVVDESGEVVAMKSNRGELEKKWDKIKGAGQGAEFDRDFDRMAKKRTSSY